MNNNQLISIICTVRNGMNHIKETIRSVINQSYTNWELIVVDDGSSDATLELLNALSANDQRITIINTLGIGRGKALNLAIQNTNGTYIANIDSDDPWHPRKLELQLKALAMNPNIYSVISTESLIIQGDRKTIWNVNLNYNGSTISDITDHVIYRNSINHSSVLMNRKHLLDVGMYDETRMSQFDYDLWTRFILKSYRIGRVPLKLSSKRIHPQQSYESKRRLNYLISSYNVQKKFLRQVDLTFTRKLRAYIHMHLKFTYGLLPRNIRMSLAQILNKK